MDKDVLLSHGRLRFVFSPESGAPHTPSKLQGGKRGEEIDIISERKPHFTCTLGRIVGLFPSQTILAHFRYQLWQQRQ